MPARFIMENVFAIHGLFVLSFSPLGWEVKGAGRQLYSIIQKKSLKN